MTRSLLARVVLALLIVTTVGQAVSLYVRARRGDSDFGIFYRTCLLLKSGIGGELYPHIDPVSGFPIVVPPSALAILQPLSMFSIGTAGAIWGVFNLFLVGVSLIALRNLLKRAGSSALADAYPWAACIFLILAMGSIQVGQFSVLIVACWILSLTALVAESAFWPGFWIAASATLKLYPGIMLAAPFSTARSARSAARHLLFLAVGLLVAGLLLPAVMYGRRAWDLDVSFFEHTLFASTPAGSVGEHLYLHTAGNQGIDTFLLRYLSYAPEFHDRYTYVPHLSFSRETVLYAAVAARLLILLVAVAAVWQWRRRRRSFGAHEVIMAAALWSATLYVLLPDTKWRYAIYTVLAFLPLLEAAAGARTQWTRVARVVEILLCMTLIVAELPDFLQAYGVGFLGALVLWVANIRRMAADAGSVSASAP